MLVAERGFGHVRQLGEAGRSGDAQASELCAKVRPLARPQDANVLARIVAILENPKLAGEDRKTSGQATLGRKR